MIRQQANDANGHHSNCLSMWTGPRRIEEGGACSCASRRETRRAHIVRMRCCTVLKRIPFQECPPMTELF